MAIGERLRLHALGCIYYQQRPFTGCQRTRDLIAEIDMAGGIDKIELIGLAIPGLIMERYTLGLDGNATLALEIHRIEHLLRHLSFA